jgi:hypothetical protein
VALFELVARVGAPPCRVFDVALDVDVHAASMAGSDEQAVDGVTAGRMGLGDVVELRGVAWSACW